MKFDILVKNIKNIHLNNQISKIYNHVNFFNSNCSDLILYFPKKKKKDHYLAKNNL